MSYKVNKQLDVKAIDSIQSGQVYDLKQADRSLAVWILLQEKLILEQQILRYSQMLQKDAHKSSEMELMSAQKIYQHLVKQKHKLDARIMRYDNKTRQQKIREEEKEKVIKELVEQMESAAKTEEKKGL